MPDQIENGHICENIVQNRSQADFQKGKKMNTQQSEQLFKASQEKIPGGVNSPVRAFGAVGRTPLFIKNAKGSHITDEDGNTYIDYVCSWGPGILGHAKETVIEAVKAACDDGLTFGAPTRKDGDRGAYHSAYAFNGNVSYGKFRYGSSNECNSCSKRIYRKIKNH